MVSGVLRARRWGAVSTVLVLLLGTALVWFALRADGQALRWATAGLESGALRDAVTVPVLSVYGSSTFPAMVEAAGRLRSVLPQTEVREVAGAHHAWDPAASAPVLAGFTHGGLPG